MEREGGLDLFPLYFFRTPPPPTWPRVGFPTDPIYSWDPRPFPLPIQGPNPPCAPRTTSPPVNSLELQCKYILRWKYMRRLLRNTLNPQMPSDNIRIHWGCKYFYLPIQFTSLHGLEVQHLSPIYNHHCTPQIFKSSSLIVFMILRFPHIYRYL